MSDGDPAGPSYVLRTTVVAPSRSIATSRRASRRGRGPASRRRCRRTGRCRSVPATAPASAATRAGRGRAGRRRRPRPPPVRAPARRRPRAGRSGSGRRRPELRPGDLEPRRRPGLVGRRLEADRQPGLGPRVGRRIGPAVEQRGTALAGPSRRQRQRARRRRSRRRRPAPSRARSQSRSRNACRLSTSTMPARRSSQPGRAGPAPRSRGAPTSPASVVGPARPGRRCRSCRRSARRRSRRRRPSASVPSGSCWTRPWSQHSQMKPPWSPGVDSIASQYSARVPLLLPIACEYSHRISGWRWRPDRGVADDRRDRRVHRAGQVADRLVARPVAADRALVVERPRRVVAADPGRGRLVVRAVAGLVAERPDDDRRVVLVAQRPSGATRSTHGAQVARVVAQRALERVGLDVRLVDDVQAELVGQVEEGRVVRVVRRPHRVEAELLHQHEVGAHLLGARRPGRCAGRSRGG